MAREITAQPETIPAVSLLALVLGAAAFGALAVKIVVAKCARSRRKVTKRIKRLTISPDKTGP
jgi:hypothetical protein